jgi:hypothetical protein
MLRCTCALTSVVLIGLCASVMAAGTPRVSVYFDQSLTMRSTDGWGAGVQTLYIVAEGFDADLTAIEYRVEYPAGMTWVADLDVPPVKIGTTESGITQAWSVPVDGSRPVVVAKALVRWDGPGKPEGQVSIRPHPVFGFIRATVAPDHHIVVAEGETSHLGRTDQRSPLGDDPVLYGAHPNPFNPVTEIRYRVSQKTHVRVTIYDVNGRLVTKLVDDLRDQGEHSVAWRAESCPSGVYFCRLEVGEFSDQRKVMLLK